jgi:hypothetical protein
MDEFQQDRLAETRPARGRIVDLSRRVDEEIRRRAATSAPAPAAAPADYAEPSP